MVCLDEQGKRDYIFELTFESINAIDGVSMWCLHATFMSKLPSLAN